MKRTCRLAVLVLAAVVLISGCSRPTERLSVLWDAPRFTLIDQAGQAFSSDRLMGQVWLADFIYTYCPDECPLYLSPKMMQTQQQILAKGLVGQVQLVSLTVDPRRDTPAILAEYGARYGADPRIWHFLTGPDATIQGILQDGFKVGSAIQADPVTVSASATGTASQNRAGDSYTLLHSSTLLLVGRDGKIRATYDGQDVEVQQMVADIQSLLGEK